MEQIIITPTNDKEAKRIAKSLDMAIVIWKILHSDNISKKSIKEIIKILDDYSIDIYDLIE